MEIAMLMIGLLLGGCVTMCVVSGIALNRYNDYESEIRRLKARLEAKDRQKTEYNKNKSTAVSIVMKTNGTAFLFFITPDRLKVR